MTVVEWFSWSDGDVKSSVRLQDVSAVKDRPSPGSSEVYIRGSTSFLSINHEDVQRLKESLGIEKQ